MDVVVIDEFGGAVCADELIHEHAIAGQRSTQAHRRFRSDAAEPVSAREVRVWRTGRNEWPVRRMSEESIVDRQ